MNTRPALTMPINRQPWQPPEDLSQFARVYEEMQAERRAARGKGKSAADVAIEVLTQSQQAAEVKSSRIWTLNDLWIQTKTGSLIRFEPNPIQCEYLDEISPGWRVTGYPRVTGLREIPLKARQEGISTMVAVVYYLITINEGHQKTVVMSYNDQGSTDLFDMVRRFYRHMPESDRPRTERANAGELVFPGIDSSYIVKTAGSTLSGRGSTVHNLHLSEMAFWKYPAVLPAIIESVTPTGNIFLESTANGEGSRTPQCKISGNMFCVYWREAKSGEMPEYAARFFPWHRNPEYTLHAAPNGYWIMPDTSITTPPFQLTTDDDQESETRAYKRYGNEVYLKRTYDLTDGQIAWRRMKIDGPGGEMFAQEYPINPEEAFMVSGHRFFRDFDEIRHVVDEQYFGGIPLHWQPIGGFDWGFASPCAFYLGWITDYDIDGSPAIIITDEYYHVNKTNSEQADGIKTILKARGILEPNLKDLPSHIQEDIKERNRRFTILADPSMWAKKGTAQGVGRADVEDFVDAGLRMVQASNNRQHGWSNFRAYLRDFSDTLKKPAIQIFACCENLLRTIPLMKQASTKRMGEDGKLIEDLDTDLEDHAIDSVRYMLNCRPRKTKMPDTPPAELTAEDLQRMAIEALQDRVMERYGQKRAKDRDGKTDRRADDGALIYEAGRVARNMTRPFGR